METSVPTYARLIAALEDLVAREAATLEARDFPAVIELQQRAAPIVCRTGHGFPLPSAPATPKPEPGFQPGQPPQPCDLGAPADETSNVALYCLG